MTRRLVFRYFELCIHESSENSLRDEVPRLSGGGILLGPFSLHRPTNPSASQP